MAIILFVRRKRTELSGLSGEEKAFRLHFCLKDKWPLFFSVLSRLVSIRVLFACACVCLRVCACVRVYVRAHVYLHLCVCARVPLRVCACVCDIQTRFSETLLLLGRRRVRSSHDHVMLSLLFAWAYDYELGQPG